LQCNSLFTAFSAIFALFASKVHFEQFKRRKKMLHAVRRTHRRASWLGADSTAAVCFFFQFSSLFTAFSAFICHARRKCSLSGVKRRYMPSAALIGVPAGLAPTIPPLDAFFSSVQQSFCRFSTIFALFLPKVPFERREKPLRAGCRTHRHAGWVGADYTTGVRLRFFCLFWHLFFVSSTTAF
jgi:hypothetical protein